jgi:hypothetical protein
LAEHRPSCQRLLPHALELGDLRGARAFYELAVRILEAAYGPDHLHARLVANNLASLDGPQE